MDRDRNDSIAIAIAIAQIYPLGNDIEHLIFRFDGSGKCYIRGTSTFFEFEALKTILSFDVTNV